MNEKIPRAWKWNIKLITEAIYKTQKETGQNACLKSSKGLEQSEILCPETPIYLSYNYKFQFHLIRKRVLHPNRKLDSIIWPVGGPKIYVTKLHGHRRSKNTDSFTFKTDQTFNLHPKLKNWFNYLTRGGPKSVTKLHGRVIFFLRNPDSVIRYSYNEARWNWHGWYW